jgi:YD repeat-containing protein
MVLLLQKQYFCSTLTPIDFNKKSNETRFSMKLLSQHLFLLAAIIVFYTTSLKAQSFYNFDGFIADSAFVITNKVKSVTIRIPTLLDDSTNKEFIPFQKLCFNPFGKIATYEYDYSEKNRDNIDYMEHYYNDTTARCYKSHRFRRAKMTGKDTLREEVVYHYDETAKLFFEEHHQLYISEFNEWTVGYEWYGDTLSIRYAENNKIDTTRFDAKGRISEYTDRNRLYKITYDSLGRRSKMTYFLLNTDNAKHRKIGEYSFIYDLGGKLERIETAGHEIVFTYDFMGLPLSSQMRDRKTGQPLGSQIVYEYDYRW